jgi:hypothetical protein
MVELETDYIRTPPSFSKGRAGDGFYIDIRQKVESKSAASHRTNSLFEINSKKGVDAQ